MTETRESSKIKTKKEMKPIFTYHLNFNTGELRKCRTFKSHLLKDMPCYFFGEDGLWLGKNIGMIGFVEIPKPQFKEIKARRQIQKLKASEQLKNMLRS